MLVIVASASGVGANKKGEGRQYRGPPLGRAVLAHPSAREWSYRRRLGGKGSRIQARSGSSAALRGRRVESRLPKQMAAASRPL